jgi:hypothetical protein
MTPVCRDVCNELLTSGKIGKIPAQTEASAWSARAKTGNLSGAFSGRLTKGYAAVTDLNSRGQSTLSKHTDLPPMPIRSAM